MSLRRKVALDVVAPYFSVLLIGFAKLTHMLVGSGPQSSPFVSHPDVCGISGRLRQVEIDQRDHHPGNHINVLNMPPLKIECRVHPRAVMMAVTDLEYRALDIARRLRIYKMRMPRV